MNKDNSLTSSLKLLAKTSVFIFLFVLLSKILTYAYRIIVARYFDPEVYGLFSTSLMVFGWFTAIATLGFSEGIVRYISYYRGKGEFNFSNYIFNFSKRVLLISSLFASIILYFSSDPISIYFFHNPKLSIFLKLMSIAIPFSILSNVYLATFRAHEKIVLNSFLFNVLQNLLKVLILVILIFLGVSNSIILSYIAGPIALFLIIYFLSKKVIPSVLNQVKIETSQKIKLRKNLFSYSLPLMFFGIFSSIFYWVDTLFIGYFKTMSEVGIYNAVIPLIFLFNFVQEIFIQLFFPLVTKEYSRGDFSLVNQLSKQIGKWIFMINLPLFLLFFIFPGQIIDLFFGADYSSGVTALVILSVGAFFSFLVPINNSLISMVGKTRILLFNLIGITLFNAILNFFLVPLYGIEGAAFSTTVSWILLSIVLAIETKYFVSIFSLRKKMLNVLLAGIVSIPVLLLFKIFNLASTKINLLLSFVFFLTLYVLIILLSRCLDSNDLLILSSFKNKFFSLSENL